MTEKEHIIEMLGYLMKKLVELEEKGEPVEEVVEEKKSTRPPLIMYEANAPESYCPRCLGRGLVEANTDRTRGYCPSCNKRYPISKYPKGHPMHMESAEMMACDYTLWKQSGGKLGKNWNEEE